MNQTLHQQLVQLRDHATAWLEGKRPRGFCPEFGICHNLPRHCQDAFFGSLLATWPEGTGDQGYPVPHPTKTPEEGYHYSGHRQMWSPVHKYARNRWALLDWMIEQTASEADQ